MRARVIDLSDNTSPDTDRLVRKTETGEETRYVDGEYLVIERKGYEQEYTPYYSENARVWLTEKIIIPRSIPYTWITSRFVVSPDDDSGMPWDDMYEWQHELVYNPPEDSGWTHFRSRHGFLHICQDPCAIVVSDTQFDDDYKWFRTQGASKQVARELVADKKYGMIDEIKEVYREGSWAVEFDETIAGVRYQESMYAVIGAEIGVCDPQRYPICELADYVIDALERDGFVVTGRPVKTAAEHRLGARKAKMARLKYRLNLFNRRA